SDVIDELIPKSDSKSSKLSQVQQDDLRSVFNVRVKSKEVHNAVPETLDETDSPVILTQSEFMRRMKEMSQMGGGMNFYGELPDSFNLVINVNHPLVIEISEDLQAKEGKRLQENDEEREKLKAGVDFMEKE